MAKKFPRFKAGEQFGLRGHNGELTLDKRAADLLNSAAEEMKRLGRVSVTPPLRWTETTGGRKFACDFNPEIMVKLSGSGNPYSFVQQQYDPATNTWSNMAGGRTGTSNCYESKGKSGLAGKVVQIAYVPTANDWRFSYVGAKACGWRIRSFGCTNSKLVPGNTLELRQGGVLIDSRITTLAAVDAITVTTAGNSYTSVPTVTISLSPFAAGNLTGSDAAASAVMQVGSLGRTSGGSGYNDGTFTGTFTGGGPGSGATFTFTVSGGVVQTLTILTRGQGYTSPPTPDFSAAGPGVGAAGTTTLNVRSITVTNGGHDYNLEPVVAISGGGGTGAAATATLALPRFSVPPGTYDVTTIPVAGRGQVTSTVSRTWSCSGNTDAVTSLVTAIDGANFSCRNVGTYPAPQVIHGTDFQGAFAMTQPSQGVWFSGYLSAPDSIADKDCNFSPGSYEYFYILSCPTSAGWQLQIQWQAKCCDGVSYKSDGSAGFNGITTILGVLGETPFMLTFNLTGYVTGPYLCATGAGREVPGHGGTVVFTG